MSDVHGTVGMGWLTMAMLIDIEKIKPMDFPSTEMDGIDVVRYLNTLPTVDAVEVVRCRDCAKDGLFTCPICFIENKTLHFINHSPDFYCGEGERKDGDGDA